MNQITTRRTKPSAAWHNGSAKPAKGRRKQRNQAGRPTADELDRRKARVMEVATELFIERGYAATSLVDIAKSAGVATRTLYQHFGDKEAIFREVIYARDVGNALHRPIVEEDDTLFSALRRACDYVYAVTYQEKSIGLMRLMIAESTRFPEFMSSIATSIFARFRRNIEKVFIALETAGLVPREDHARSAELFADLAQGSHPIMVYTNWDAQPPSSDDLDERVDLFILGRFGPTVARTARTKKAKRSPAKPKTERASTPP
jgi:TetR/AcrR family transcriptional repressor of mexJK operon